VIVLWSLLSPVMACMKADAQMTVQERACCRMMNGQCGDMQMPASHGCCHKTLQSIEQNALNAKTVALPPFIAITATAAAFELSAPTSASANWVERPQHSPPVSPPSSVSILRI
jgi:hypothetical protein